MQGIIVLLLFASAYGLEQSGKIIGGGVAQEGQFPYVASVRRVSASGDRLMCAGAIVSSRHVLTAAHCVSGLRPQEVVLRVGSTALDGGQLVRLRAVLVHDQYDPNNLNNDIALLVTASTLRWSATVSRVSVSPRTPPPHAPLAAAGWGRLAVPGLAPAARLHYLHLYLVSQRDCDKVLGPGLLGGQNVCALPLGQDAAMSMYDDGAPLVHDSGLVGIASWALPGALGFPQVFTDVNFYARWIADKILEN